MQRYITPEVGKPIIFVERGATTIHVLKIQNARICDGLGNPMTDGAVAVTASRIAAIGDVPAAANEFEDSIPI